MLHQPVRPRGPLPRARRGGRRKDATEAWSEARPTVKRRLSICAIAHWVTRRREQQRFVSVRVSVKPPQIP
eukprot:6186320-Prymnesium_polylepis.1